MFYLIVCEEDQSFCTVEDFEIACDVDQPPMLDEIVQFFYGKERYSGTVIGISANGDVLKEKAKKLKLKRQVPISPVETSPLPPKRPRKPKKSFSFTDENTTDLQINKIKTKTAKTKNDRDKYTANLQNQIKSKICNDKKESRHETPKQKSTTNEPFDNSPEISPTKDELKIMVEKQKKLLKSYQSSSGASSALNSEILQKKVESSFEDSENSSSSVSDVETPDKSKKEMNNTSEEMDGNQSQFKKKVINLKDDETLCPQLWGKDCGEPVILLKNNIYCKKATFDDAEDLCRKSASSFLRRLMDGVFKPEVLLNLNCTYSGRPPSAQGKNKQLQKVVALDRTAKKALIEFCNDYATQHGWPKSKESELGTAMSQWIGELKRTHEKNVKRNT